MVRSAVVAPSLVTNHLRLKKLPALPINCEMRLRKIAYPTEYFLGGDLSWCGYKHALKYRPIAVACSWGALIVDPDFEL